MNNEYKSEVNSQEQNQKVRIIGEKELNKK